MSDNNNDKKQKDETQNSRTQIILALVGLVGTVSVAVIGNFDKFDKFLSRLFTPPQSSIPTPSPSPPESPKSSSPSPSPSTSTEPSSPSPSPPKPPNASSDSTPKSPPPVPPIVVPQPPVTDPSPPLPPTPNSKIWEGDWDATWQPGSSKGTIYFQWLESESRLKQGLHGSIQFRTIEVTRMDSEKLEGRWVDGRGDASAPCQYGNLSLSLFYEDNSYKFKGWWNYCDQGKQWDWSGVKLDK
jgi:hypothetical protein